MPNIKSAIKRVSSSARRNEINKSQKSALKTSVKKAQNALEASADNLADIVKMTQADLDKAVARGLIHKNKAAHKKSQLARKLNKVQE